MASLTTLPSDAPSLFFSFFSMEALLLARLARYAMCCLGTKNRSCLAPMKMGCFFREVHRALVLFSLLVGPRRRVGMLSTVGLFVVAYRFAVRGVILVEVGQVGVLVRCVGATRAGYDGVLPRVLFGGHCLCLEWLLERTKRGRVPLPNASVRTVFSIFSSNDRSTGRQVDRSTGRGADPNGRIGQRDGPRRARAEASGEMCLRAVRKYDADPDLFVSFASLSSGSIARHGRKRESETGRDGVGRRETRRRSGGRAGDERRGSRGRGGTRRRFSAEGRGSQICGDRDGGDSPCLRSSARVACLTCPSTGSQNSNFGEPSAHLKPQTEA